MQYRHIVISGFTLTALLVAVTLNGWVPYWAIAVLILAAGLGLTYLLALKQKQQEYLARQQALVRALQDLLKADSYPSLFKYLEVALRRVLTGEVTEVKVLEPAVAAFPEENPVWADLVNRAGAGAGLVKITGEDEDWYGLTIKAPGSENRETVLCWREKHNPAGLPVQDEENVNTIAAAASQVLARLDQQQRNEQFLNQLLQITIKAGEDQVPGFSGHSQRVALIADILGQQLGLDERESRDLHYAALLHDIGRYKVSQDVDEDHPVTGARAFPADDEWNMIREAVQFHHERYDGNGFPEGRKMTDIPLLARILAVADIFDGLTALTPEEHRLSPQQAYQAIQKETGSGFDH